MHSNKNLLYVNNMGGGTISEINLKTKHLDKNHIVHSNPGHHTISKNNEILFICDNKNKLFYQYNLLQDKVVRSLKFDENALLFGIDDNENFAIVLHWYHNKISVVNIKEMTVAQTINIHRPIGIDFGDDFFLVSAQSFDIDFGCAKGNTQLPQMADLIHHRCDVQQGFGWDATHIQANPAQSGIALDQYHFQTQIGSTKSR